VFIFLSGVVLLFSGATPAAADGSRRLERVLPLGVIEASHFLSSVLGARSCCCRRGLARRLDAAFLLAAVAMALGHRRVAPERGRLRRGRDPGGSSW
jgi:phosphatidylglycerol lysyltransferase